MKWSWPPPTEKELPEDWTWPEPGSQAMVDFLARFSCDPLNTWDDSNSFVNTLPPTHWRRKNPELRCDTIGTGGIHGGKTFGGFRVWRSVSPVENDNSWALIKQIVVMDSLNFEDGDTLNPETTIQKQYTYVDSNLVRGRLYRYAVTSFTLPGITLVSIKDTTTQQVRTDTLLSPPTETSFGDNEQLVILPFEPSSKLGQVKVVPNPYRSDADYTYENGGYEGLGREWIESRRVIWFIHLPRTCAIRIFSLAGDLVASIGHDDQVRIANNQPVGQEEWHLLSESGRAIASGIYVYAVESEFGRQVGKFVVIR
jgi:hypothetical protein